MSEVIFQRIAPVVTVHDVDADLGRYRQLGFATELDQPAGYGFAERGAVQLHLQSDDPNDPGGRAISRGLDVEARGSYGLAVVGQMHL